MDDLQDALNAVNTAIAKCKARERKRLTDTSGHVSTHLVLLKLSSISQQLSEKLATFLRHSLGVLYAAVPVPALRLAAAIFESVYHNRILSAIGGGQSDQKELWESVLYALLSGVLDFLDAHDNRATKDAVGKTLFSILCDVCFSLTAPKTGVDLRCTAYNILIDASASHQGNQNILRDPKVLGGERLGSCIWRTKDYLALEGLLNLFARALPSTNNSASGRVKRTTFIQSVFKSTVPPEAGGIADSVSQLLENVPSSDWEETAVKVLDAFARGNISYPQPLPVNELIVGDETYPSDRLYADDKTFLANVLLGDDQYESLEIAYTSLERIRLDRVGEGRMRVTLDLSMAPRLGKELLELKSSDEDRQLKATFVVRTEQAQRLSQVLGSRGLSQLVLPMSEPRPKLSLAFEPATLEIDSAGRLVEPSQSERIENVSQFYRTDDPSDDIQSAGDFDEFVAAIEVSSQLINPFAVGMQDVRQVAEASKPEVLKTGNQLSKPSSTLKSTALARTGSQLVRDAGLGGDVDDLSDISTDSDSPTPTSKLLRRTSTSASAKLVRGRLSFEPVSAAKDVGRFGRGRVGKIILDSDDDSPPAPPAKSRPRPANRTLLREPTADDPLEEHPDASLPVPLVPPATPPSQQDRNTLVAASGLGLQSGSAKVLRFSDVIPAPNFNAALSSPVVVPKSVLKSALVKKPPAPPAAPDDALLDSSPPRGPPARNTRATKPATSKVEDPLYDLIPPSSSPTPGAKRSVKAALRKKDEPASAVKAAKKGQPASATVHTSKPAKRKALADVETDENVPPVANDTEHTRPAKRARTTPTPPTPSEQEDVKPKLPSDAESQVLRPAMRARKQYRAKRGRTSSPADGSDAGPKSRFVDYDALPSPPRAATASVRSTPPRKVKTKAAEAKAAEAEKTAKPARVTKTKNSDATIKVDKTEKTTKPKAEKAANTDKVVKPEKSEKTTNTEQTIVAEEVQKDKIVQNTAPQVGELVKSTATAAPRGPPRPRRVCAKDKAKENVKQAEAKEGSSARSVRTSARAAAAAEKRVQDKKGEEEQTLKDDVAHGKTEDVPKPMEAGSELPLFVDTSPPKSDIVPNAAYSKYKQKLEPAVVARIAEPEGVGSVTKTSSKAPWDVLAEKTLDNPPTMDDFVADIPDVTADNDPADASPGPEADITLVQPSSPVVVHKAPTSASKLEAGIKATTPQSIIKPKPRKDISDAPEIAPPIISKPSPIVIKREVECIDLTFDSPLKAPKRRTNLKVAPEEPRRRSPRLAVQTADVGHAVEEPDVVHAQQYLPELPLRPSVHPTVRFVSESLRSANEVANEEDHGYAQCSVASQVGKPSLPFSKRQAARRKQGKEKEVAPQDERPVYHEDPCMQRIIEVLDDLHEVVVQSVKNRFEGLREDVRAGRDELLRRAADDLHVIRAESVVHFNALVDLEAEYATVGRNVIHETEDWIKVNQEICRELSAAVETHDRSMLSKKMPATLVSVKL
ncbi:hypothetical protein L226DRAFT_230828 [Lentinus tigrinus ALCF2SS1-7]|nr:hypothetical protein L226DRAFT_230828 [Lentinus tigrinus ALCF2SS1-7]